ncbi:MAG: DUF1320 family protein [Porticoccaceae bacterium]|nr:DUF1320 family protein [Porticoccaceae bacterium]
MPYTTPVKLQRFGADHLTQLCAAKLGENIDSLLLTLALESADLAAYSSTDQALASDALAWVQSAIDDAGKRIDSYLMGSYTLPLSQVQIDASVLPEHAENIAYHQLMIHGPDKITEQRYSEAMAWLKDVARGVAKIGGLADTEAVANTQQRLACPLATGLNMDNY